MLAIYDTNNVENLIPLIVDDTKRYITHKYNGLDTLTFEIDTNNENARYIIEEAKVQDEKNLYVIKKVDEHSDFMTITCDLDLDDLKADFYYTYRKTNVLLATVLEDILPADWSYTGTGHFMTRTTIEGNEGEPLELVTPYDILNEAVADAYGCIFNYDCINKVLNVIDINSYTSTGEFFTDEVNLKNLGFTGDSQNFATRLYAYGKKDDETGVPITFADINGGKEYVQNLKYSDKIISVGWSDERYTVKENLLTAAKEKLEELAFPVRSYTCDVINLDKDIWMYKLVTLIDRKRKISVEHRVVEYKEYPLHELDVVTLSSVSETIQSKFDKIQTDTDDKLSYQETNMQNYVKGTIKKATDKITGNNGGYFVWVFDEDGKPIELVNLNDSADLNTAQKVWRWNASGLGHSNNGYNGNYTLAILDDGSINADVITTGTLNAELIRAGILSDIKQNVTWDLENGLLEANKLSIQTPNFILDESGTVKAVNADIIGTITSSTITGGTITGSNINNGEGTFIVDEEGKMEAHAITAVGSICGVNGYDLCYDDMAKPPQRHTYSFAKTGITEMNTPYLLVTAPDGTEVFQCGQVYYETKAGNPTKPYIISTPIFNNGIFVENAVINTLAKTSVVKENMSNGSESVDITAKVSGAFVTVYGSYHAQVHEAGISKEIVLGDDLLAYLPTNQHVKAVGYSGKKVFIFTLRTDGKIAIRNASAENLSSSTISSIIFRFDFFRF